MSLTLPYMWPWNNHKHRKENKEVVIIEETNVVIIEGEHYKKFNPEKEELEIIEKLVGIVDRLTQDKKERVRLVLTTILNNNKFIVMSITLNANQFSLDTLSLIDSDTNAAVAATFANQSFASSDPSIFTSTQDVTDPNSTKDVAVGAGTASLNISADVTYTDANTNQPVTKTLTLVVDVTVVAVVAGENVALVLTQGAPQQQ